MNNQFIIGSPGKKLPGAHRRLKISVAPGNCFARTPFFQTVNSNRPDSLLRRLILQRNNSPAYRFAQLSGCVKTLIRLTYFIRHIKMSLLSGYGGTGRRASLRSWWETVQVQVLLSALIKAFILQHFLICSLSFVLSFCQDVQNNGLFLYSFFRIPGPVHDGILSSLLRLFSSLHAA
jgi:hypothetical protein